MKKRLSALALVLCMVVCILPVTAAAADACPEHTAGTFNGSEACVKDGMLHLCENNFPDENFRSYIAPKDTDADGYLTAEEVNSVTSIACQGDNISSLKGVEFFTSLEELDCSANYLDTLDVSKNTALKYLDCYSSDLDTLDVSKNTALEYLNCNENWLDFLDLSKNTTLEHLECERNNLSFLDLSKNTALEYLNCYFNGLDTLDVSNNTALEYLDCAKNGLETLDVSRNTALVVLNCDYNGLDNLDVSKNTALEELYCGRNSLTSLDVSKNTALKRLSCTSTKLAALDVSKNTALEGLSCEKVGLTSLDVSQNTALEYLYCRDNSLTSLDVSKNTALEELYCGRNSLTSLDVSKNTALDNFDCAGNRLSVLDLSNNNKLKYANANAQELPPVSYREGTYQLSLAELVGSENLGNIISVTATDLAGNTRELTMAADGTVTCDADTYYVEYLYDTGCPSLDEIMNVGMGIGSNTETGACLGHTAGTFNGSPACVKDGMLHLCAINFPDGFFRYIIRVERDLDEDGYLSAEEVSNVIGIDTVISDTGFAAVKSLKGVEFFTSLEILVCTNNMLTELDVSKNTALVRLECGGNRLTSLDVSRNTALEVLWCHSNNLTTLDVSKNTALISLSCDGNNLTSLDVSQNTALEYLSCDDNNLTALDVSQNTALVELECNHNYLTTLDVSKNTALEVLSCSNNNLTALDVSKNTALESLWCSDNNLPVLDVWNNDKLEIVYAEDQQLLQVSYREGTYQLSLAELVGSENLGNIISVTATDLAGNTRELTMAADGTVTCDADTYYVEYLYDTGCPTGDEIMNVGMYMIPDVKFVGASLSLKGDIGLNFFVILPDDLRQNENAYMRFTMGSTVKTVPLSQGVLDPSDGSYRYAVALNAKNMGDNVTAQVYIGDTSVGGSKTLSIKYYADYAIANSSKEKLVNLMKAMLNYGAAAQTEFGYDTANLVNADMSEADQALPENVDVSQYVHTWSGEESGIQVTSASLLLQSETKIRIYFKLAEGKSISDFVFTVDGKEVTPTQDGDEYYIEKANIAAKDLDTMYTFCMGGRSLTYCGLSYVNQVQTYSKNDTDLMNLARALYCYNQAANAYFGA